MRYSNWPNIIISTIGSLTIVKLFKESEINLLPWIPVSFYFWLSIIILLIGIIWLIVRIYVRKQINDFKMDEREKAISDKSGRNGLLATYVALYILLATDLQLNEKTLLIVITIGFLTWVVSLFFLIYKKA